jgi:hypothetical protein
VNTATEIQGGALLEDPQHHGGPEVGDPVIWVQDLTKVYRGGITAVDGLDLSVGRGALTVGVPHMNLWLVAAAMSGFILALGVVGTRGFRRRVID